MRFQALLWMTLLLTAPSWGQSRRFALVVGENRGLVNEEQLRFAQSDAQRVRDTLVDVGGFAAQDVTTLTGATASSLQRAMATLRTSMGPGPHERLVVYVSSHAAEGALHLAGTQLPLQELVDFIKGAPVQVGLLIVDACQSGSLTRLKGVRIASPVAPRIEATGIEGRVFISASGADEYAQESDALQGSYFTHYLLAGLRGAADSSGDGKVTLEEAYGWAWARTIEATFSSTSGVQRPAFSADLRGAGQLVLADPGRSNSVLVLKVKAPGRWLVVSEATGSVYADLYKAEGPISLALPAGTYRAQLRVSNGALERTVTVPPNGTVTLSDDELEQASLMKVVRKGGEEVQVVLSAAASISSGSVLGLVAEAGAELRLRRDGYLLGPLNQLSGSFCWRDASPPSRSFHQTELELRVGSGHRFAWHQASLMVGLEVGPLLILQSRLPDGTSRTSLGLTMGLALEGRVVVAGPVELLLLGSGGGAALKKLAGVAMVPRLSAALGLALRF